MRGASFLLAAAVAALAGCGARGLLLMDPPPRTVSDPDPASVSGSFDSGPSVREGLRSGCTVRPLDPQCPPASAYGIVWSRLRAPHLAKTKMPVATPTTVAEARALVGERDPRSPVAFALAVAGGLSGIRALPDVGDGPALVAWAEGRGALAAIVPGTPDTAAIAVGDLLVFDRVVGGAPASLVAVALGRDDRGVIDMLYLAGGVIRRGHLDPARPRTTRDRDRRIVNTFLRHGADQPPGDTRFRAGALVVARVRLPLR